MNPGPLAGRRVLEIADPSGMYCGKLFADLGADVIRIEPPGGDPARSLPPLWKEARDPELASLPFLYLNTSKRCVTLDLQSARGRALFLELAATADIVVETLPPGRIAELGLGYETLRARKRSIIVTSITGFGQDGPHRQYASSDLIASALGGVACVTGESDDPPVVPAGSQAQLMASTCAAASSMIALFESAGSGRGQHVDISVQEVTASVCHISGTGKWLDDGIVPRRMGSGLFASVPSGAYRCTDGLVYLMVNRPAHWKALAEWIHAETGEAGVLDPLFEGPSSVRIPYRELIDHYVSELTLRHSVTEIFHEGQRRHLALTPVQRPAEVAHDPQLEARGFFVEVDHGDRQLRYAGAPYRFSRAPWQIYRRAPSVGEHNEEVFCAELGMTLVELARLRSDGVV